MAKEEYYFVVKVEIDHEKCTTPENWAEHVLQIPNNTLAVHIANHIKKGTINVLSFNHMKCEDYHG